MATQPKLDEFAPPGRLSEFTALDTAWREAATRRSSVVVLRADTGLGKTHLVQKFFRWLSASADPDAYWPPELPDDHKAMTIIPPMPPRPARDTPPIPWLWLAIRCRDPGERNRDARGGVAFDVVRRQLRFHLVGLYRAQRRRRASATLAKATISTLASFALPGAGELVHAIQQSVSEGVAVWDEFDAALKRFGLRRRDRQDLLAQTLVEERSSLANEAVSALGAIADKREGAAPAVPIILVVDDAHWADPTTLEVIERLLVATWEEGWPLLVVMTAWDESLREQERDTKRLSVSRVLNACRLPVVELSLPPLDVSRLRALVIERLPNLEIPAADILAQRCSGDLDLLFDFVDELREAPAWLDEAGGLSVPLDDLNELPSKASDMARQRLRTMGSSVAMTLAYASTQGMEFHESIVRSVAEQFDAADGLHEELVASDEQYGVTKIRSHPLLDLGGEFRRHVYWEVSAEIIHRQPGKQEAVLSALARALRQTFEGPSWDALSRRERGLLGGRLLELLDELRLDTSGWTDLRGRLQLELAVTRLDMGDIATAELMAESALAQGDVSQAFRTIGHRILVEAAYTAGDLPLERRRLQAWRGEEGGAMPELLLRAASLAARSGEPDRAVEYAQEATEASDPDSPLALTVASTLAQVLWAAGRAKESLAVLAKWEHRFTGEAQVDFDHVAAMALHDLERNLRVVDHVRRCVDAYRSAGRIEAQIISAVNLGDAYWGAGMLNQGRQVLAEAHRASLDAGLPHAEDIAAICLANVLAAQGELDEALQLYKTGITLAKKIGHDWDEIYGLTYHHLAMAERGEPGQPERLFGVSQRAASAKYHYLESLALAHAPIAAMQHSPAVAREVLDESLRRAPQDILPGPHAYLTALQVLLTNDDQLDHALSTRFLKALGRCEGLKGRPDLIVRAIDRCREHKLISLIQAEFANRWQARFAWESRHGPAKEEALLKVCDYRSCEARCCYDGVYLEDGDAERIASAIQLNPKLFAHLPGEPIVHGTWKGLSGRKTAVRPHEYKSPDFPDHFDRTRCVFALDDGACSLQTLAVQRGEEPWTYKPTGCCFHPLSFRDGPSPPPNPGERDEQYEEVNYPGYVTHTPCGQHRGDGKPWKQALGSELALHRSGAR